MSGIMNPTPEVSTLRKQIQEALGPSKAPLSLDEYLAQLSEQELNHLLSIAKMVKIAHGFGSNRNRSYVDLIREMYPRFHSGKRSLIGAIMQDANPIENKELTPIKSAVDNRSEALDEWASALRTPAPEPAVTSLSTNTDPFIESLTQSESSGNTQAEITIKDGRTFAGKLQFGEARLQDYKAATGKAFTQDEFKADEVLQDEVGAWHVAEIDKVIDALGDAAKGYDRNGLRSVAHLGGQGGMRQFVKSSGEYNPADELGTSLQDYYEKFSGKTS
tara:strand:- start:2963 stop:3787 length:825 start_codon:yes stop_codon:yes gene_type:complete